MKYFTDPKTGKESVSLTVSISSFIITSVILVASVILMFTTKQLESSALFAIGAISVTYMSACFTLYFGRRKDNVKNLQEIIKVLKKEVE